MNDSVWGIPDYEISLGLGFIGTSWASIDRPLGCDWGLLQELWLGLVYTRELAHVEHASNVVKGGYG